MRDIEFLSIVVKNSMPRMQYFCQETEMIEIFTGRWRGHYLTKFPVMGLEPAHA
jgi:hypothetical protein